MKQWGPETVIMYMVGLQKYGWPNRVVLLLVILAVSTIISMAQDLPDKPDLIRVSVDHSDNGVLIQWEASTDQDIAFYHLYKMNEDLAFERVFTFSSNTVEYKHLTSGLKNLAYAVTAEDSTGNESLFEDNVQRAVVVSVEFDPCDADNIITWSAYEGWEGEIAGYLVMGGPSGGPFDTIEFTPPTRLTSTDTAVGTGIDYSYYIETVNIHSDSSFSAIETVSASYPEAPDYMSVDYVSVIDRSTIEIQFSADTQGPINDFRLMRRSNPATPYLLVEDIPDAQQSVQLVTDQFQSIAGSYEYVVQSIYHPPQCIDPIFISQSLSRPSLHLVASFENQMTTLTWTPYLERMADISGFVIQRRKDDGEFVTIEPTLAPETTLWREPIESIINGHQLGEIQYRVLGMGVNQGAGGAGISISNVAGIQIETNMLIPNAFTPGSEDINAFFKPLVDFAPKDYLLIIVDRVGRKLFETTDPGNGWDGRFQNGSFVSEGVYVYYIQYTDYTGILKSYTGNVTVLYP